MEGDSHLIFSDEYRLLETYCQKRRKPSSRPLNTANMYRMQAQMGPIGGERFSDVAEKLTLIANSTVSDDGIECDGPTEDIEISAETDKERQVIKKLVELLKVSGDDLNNKIQNNHQLLGYLHTFNYSSFDKVAKAFISSMLPQCPQKPSEREEIALTFEVTSRLEALDLQPMNRVMGYGAQYLQINFAPWITQHGGWEKAFDDDEEVH